jgi:hypothetical protein
VKPASGQGAPVKPAIYWLDLALLAALGLALYWPVLGFNFFWEDPFDIGQVDGLGYADLLVAPNSNSYYRPLALAGLKALKLGGEAYPAWAYHAMVVAGHLAAGLVLYGFARHVFERRGYALAAAAVFLAYPVPYEATARASSFHHWLVAALIGCLWLYARWRQGGAPGNFAGALALATLGLGLHENAIVVPALVVLFELWLVLQRRVPRFHPAALAFGLPAAAFVLIWLSIPKSGEPPQFGLHAAEALYLSQGLSFPIAGPLAWAGGLGLPPAWQAALALAASLALLLAAHGSQGRPRLALALAAWVTAVSLAWLARPIEYLQVSPRVLYFPSFAAALAWAGILDLRLPWATGWGSSRLPGVGALLALLGACAWPLTRSTALYSAGSRLMDELVAVGTEAGGARLLFVNFPDRFEYAAPLYPLGYWGMLVAPVSQDLADFVWLARGARVETRSLSDFPLLAGPLAASPYQVNTRGSDAHASEVLYDSLLWADEAYWTEYLPDGRLGIRPVGEVRPAGTAATPLGEFGGMVRLLPAEADWDEGTLTVSLRWLPLRPAGPDDTVFVHVLNSDNQLVTQADGDGLGGLAPLSAWRPGHEIVDRRMVLAAGDWPAGEYVVKVGLYQRVSGARYVAVTADGQAAPDSALEVFRWANE